MENKENGKIVLEKIVLENGVILAGNRESLLEMKQEAHDYINSIGIKEYSSYINEKNMNEDFGIVYESNNSALIDMLIQKYQPILMSPGPEIERVYAIPTLGVEGIIPILIPKSSEDSYLGMSRLNTEYLIKSMVMEIQPIDVSLKINSYQETKESSSSFIPSYGQDPKKFHNKKAFEKSHNNKFNKKR